MSRIFDNIATKFEDGLHAILAEKGVVRADFCAGYFNLRGWRFVAEDVDRLPGGEALEKNARGVVVPVARVCRLLIGMYAPEADLVHEMYALSSPSVDAETARRWRRKVMLDFRRQLVQGIPTAEDEAALQLLRRQLAEGKVCVKLFLRHQLHAKLYLAHAPADKTAPIRSIMGSSNLTFNGLVRNGELNAEFGDARDNLQYAQWFNARWDDAYAVDFTQELIEVLDASWASILGPTPYEIYLKIMYHLSREARKGVSEYRLPKPFDVELFDFQKTAVKLAVRHLEKRGGAMIGDVVGLGKTITACAVAKFYEETLGASTLVLCPPNLQDMWHGYANTYDLKMTVRSMAAKFDPAKERFYRLVIIDESHNLRNGEGSRYAMIRDLLAYQGNKVLLLTATPYNKDFSDLGHQLRLFVNPDADLGVRPEQQIRAEGGEQQFALKYSDVPLGSIRAFEKSFCADDWRDLMKLYLVRRTRTFIKKHYALTDPASGRKYLEMRDGSRNYFPDRIPKTIRFRTTPGDMFERLYNERMVDWMGELALPRYGLQLYIDAAKAAEAPACDRQILRRLSLAGKRMMGFCRSGFYKRMDSSGVAFLMSLYRHAVRNAMYLHAIRNDLDLPIRLSEIDIGTGLTEDLDASGETLLRVSPDPAVYTKTGRDAYEELVASAPASVAWISPKFFKKSLTTALKKDNAILLEMLAACGEWKPKEDEKLNALEKLIARKHAEEKVLVFTQFKDTARYLAEQLQARGHLQVEEVDGEDENSDILSAVNRFSPFSNHATPPVSPERQIRVLISTDMLSEGQNLQDGHIVVNYDLPWAIIRLIQRAGRVDRIGQKAPQVFCYSFFPQEGINEVIHLRDRLNDRINANAEAVGSDEVFFEGNKQNLADIFNEKAGILDEPDDDEVDLASQAYQIWEQAVKDDPTLRDRIPALADVVYSTKPCGAEGDGVITYARTKSDNDVLVWLDAQGRTVSQSPTRIFQALACRADTPRLVPLANHHELVAESIGSIQSHKIAPAGVLGPKSSTKHRVFTILQNRLKANAMPLFEQDLKQAADQVYAYAMKESAKNALGKMLQRHESEDDIIQAVLDFYRDGELCLVPDEFAVDGWDETRREEARIICSMGMRKA